MAEKMEMHLLGSFYLRNENAVLDEEILHSDKLTKILVYLIIHRDRAVLHQELMEVFGAGNSQNPQGALKNLMYRLRTALKVFGEEEYVCTSFGAYRWNPDVEVKTDYECFEEMVSEAADEKDETRKKELCRKAITEYRGNVFKRINRETWMLARVEEYRSLFIDLVKSLAIIYEKEKDWEELEHLCDQALSADPLDEDFHYWIVESLLEQNKNDMAILHYENASKMLYESLGIRTTEKMQSIFRKAVEKEKGDVKDIQILTAELEETEKPEGAFFCEYQNFLQIYRVEVRRNSRLGISEYLVLITLRRTDSVKREPEADSGLAEGIQILENILKEMLRVGDVVARYSFAQYIILLPICNYESSVMVAERIKTAFQRSIGKKRLELVYEVEELMDEKNLLEKEDGENGQ